VIKHLADLVVVVLWAVVVVAVACCDAIGEDAKKRKLGARYEGPLED
jgi:hypothetical protein